MVRFFFIFFQGCEHAVIPPFQRAKASKYLSFMASRKCSIREKLHISAVIVAREKGPRQEAIHIEETVRFQKNILMLIVLRFNPYRREIKPPICFHNVPDSRKQIDSFFYKALFYPKERCQLPGRMQIGLPDATFNIVINQPVVLPAFLSGL